MAGVARRGGVKLFLMLLGEAPSCSTVVRKFQKVAGGSARSFQLSKCELPHSVLHTLHSLRHYRHCVWVDEIPSRSEKFAIL